MSTDSTSAPSNSRHSVLRVVPPSVVISLTGVSRSGSSADNRSLAAAGRSVIASTSVVNRSK